MSSGAKKGQRIFAATLCGTIIIRAVLNCARRLRTLCLVTEQLVSRPAYKATFAFLKF